MIAPASRAAAVPAETAGSSDQFLRTTLIPSSPPLLRPAGAVALVCTLTLLFAAIDFSVPGEVNVAILYGLSVGACAWSLSRRFLWAVTAACVILTYLGQAFGPPPVTSDAVLPFLWIDRGVVAAGLIVLAGFIHQWIRRSERLDAAHALLLEQNETLCESEWWFRATFEQAAVGVAHIDLAGRMLRINERLCDIIGYAREELLGRNFRDITHPDDRDADAAAMQALIAGEIRTYTLEKRYIGKDGRPRWVSVTRSLARHPSGAPKYAISMVEDIAARKRVEDDLLHMNESLERRVVERTRELAASNDRLRLALAERDKAEALYRMLYNRAPVPQHSLDGTGRIISVSDTWLALLGYEREQVLGRSMREFIAPRLCAAFDKSFPRLLEKGSLRGVEIEMVKRTGEIVPVLLAATVERDDKGRFVRTLGALVDITARKQVERERDRLFELSNDLLAIAGLDGRFRDVNQAVATAFGVPRDQILATPFIEFVHPEERPLVGQMLERLAQGERAVEFEVRYRHGEGWHWSAWKVTAIWQEGILYGVGRDIHRQRLAEESLRHSQKMQAIGQLTGGVAHDFNNILTTIIGNLEMIAAGSGDDAQRRRRARAALQSAEHAARLVEHLLAFSRRQRLAPQVVRTEDAVRNMLPLWRRALGVTVELSLELPGDLWPCRLDPAQFEAAILNLIINARDAMPNGGRVTVGAHNVTVAAGTISDLAAGDYVLVSVTDTGTGIPADILSRVFEPFFTTKEVGKGSGLGLSMVYGFVTQSGGTVSIESKPGAGTSVQLYLPRALSGEIQKTASDALEDREASSGATILVVEDEEQVRQVTADALEGAGFRVLRAGDGAEALALLRDIGRVDLVVSDIIMPGGIDGIELARKIQRSAQASPVLLTTGDLSKLGGSPVGEQGFDVLPKPFRPTELCTKVRQIVAATSAQSRGAESRSLEAPSLAESAGPGPELN